MIIRRKPVGFANLRKPQSLGMDLLRNGVSRMQALTVRRVAQSDEPIEWGDGIPDDVYNENVEQAEVVDPAQFVGSQSANAPAARPARRAPAANAQRQVQRQPQAAPPPPVQRQPGVSFTDDKRTPTDLRAIMEGHRAAGHVKDDPTKHAFSKSLGIFNKPGEQNAPVPQLGSGQPVQRTASDQPTTGEPTPRIRRRSKIVDVTPPKQGLPFNIEDEAPEIESPPINLYKPTPAAVPASVPAPTQRTPDTASPEPEAGTNQEVQRLAHLNRPTEILDAIEIPADLPNTQPNTTHDTLIEMPSATTQAWEPSAEEGISPPKTYRPTERVLPAVQRTPGLPLPSSPERYDIPNQAALPRSDRAAQSPDNTPSSTFESGDYDEPDDEADPAGSSYPDLSFSAPESAVQRAIDAFAAPETEVGYEEYQADGSAPPSAPSSTVQRRTLPTPAKADFETDSSEPTGYQDDLGTGSTDTINPISKSPSTVQPSRSQASSQAPLAPATSTPDASIQRSPTAEPPTSQPSHFETPYTADDPHFSAFQQALARASGQGPSETPSAEISSSASLDVSPTSATSPVQRRPLEAASPDEATFDESPLPSIVPTQPVSQRAERSIQRQPDHDPIGNASPDTDTLPTISLSQPAPVQRTPIQRQSELASRPPDATADAQYTYNAVPGDQPAQSYSADADQPTANYSAQPGSIQRTPIQHQSEPTSRTADAAADAQYTDDAESGDQPVQSYGADADQPTANYSAQRGSVQRTPETASDPQYDWAADELADQSFSAPETNLVQRSYTQPEPESWTVEPDSNALDYWSQGGQADAIYDPGQSAGPSAEAGTVQRSSSQPQPEHWTAEPDSSAQAYWDQDDKPDFGYGADESMMQKGAPEPGSIQRTPVQPQSEPETRSRIERRPDVPSSRPSQPPHTTSATVQRASTTEPPAGTPPAPENRASSFSSPYTPDDPHFTAFQSALARAQSRPEPSASVETVQRSPTRAPDEAAEMVEYADAGFDDAGVDLGGDTYFDGTNSYTSQPGTQSTIQRVPSAEWSQPDAPDSNGGYEGPDWSVTRPLTTNRRTAQAIQRKRAARAETPLPSSATPPTMDLYSALVQSGWIPDSTESEPSAATSNSGYTSAESASVQRSYAPELGSSAQPDLYSALVQSGWIQSEGSQAAAIPSDDSIASESAPVQRSYAPTQAEPAEKPDLYSALVQSGWIQDERRHDTGSGTSANAVQRSDLSAYEYPDIFKQAGEAWAAGRADSGYTTPAQPTVQRSTYESAPTSAEADLLRILGKPADTPITRGPTTTLTVNSPNANQKSTGKPGTAAASNSVQREVASEAASLSSNSVASSTTATQTSTPPAPDGNQEVSKEELEKMAQAIYSLLRQRLKIERERLTGKIR